MEKNINQLNNESYTYQKIIDLLKKNKLLENYGKSNIEVYYLGNGIYEVYTKDTKNVQFFCDKEGNIILSIKPIINDYFFKEALLLAGLYYYKKENEPTVHLYILKYNGKNVYDLDLQTLYNLVYKLQNGGKIETNQEKIKESLKRLTFFIIFGPLHILFYKKENYIQGLTLGKEINKFSYEYFKAWENIYFFENRLFIHAIKKRAIQFNDLQGFFEISNDSGKNTLDILLQDGIILIKDIEFFAKYNLLSKNPEKNEKLKQYYIKQITNNRFLIQIRDERFYKTGDQITLQQVENYYKKGYLPESIYEKAKSYLQEINSLENKKQKEINNIKAEHKKMLDEFYEKYFGIKIE